MSAKIEPVHADSDLFEYKSAPTLSDYHKLLMHAQISGTKWIEIEPELMEIALLEVSRAVGTDMSGHKSFVQNDIRVYLKGTKTAMDEKEARSL